MLYGKLQSYVGEEFLIKNTSYFPSKRGIKLMKMSKQSINNRRIETIRRPLSFLNYSSYRVIKNILTNFIEYTFHVRNAIPNTIILLFFHQESHQNMKHNEQLKQNLIEFMIKCQQIRDQSICQFTFKINSAGIVNVIEENPDDLYFETNQKDWELQNLKQKLISISKRILMLAKIREFIKKFKEHQLKILGIKDKSQLKQDYLLGFIPSSSFYSKLLSISISRNIIQKSQEISLDNNKIFDGFYDFDKFGRNFVQDF